MCYGVRGEPRRVGLVVGLHEALLAADASEHFPLRGSPLTDGQQKLPRLWAGEGEGPQVRVRIG
eukprot:2496767-Prymnesium_polylepis.1